VSTIPPTRPQRGFPPVTVAANTRTHSIVAIHGLEGDLIGTWTHSKTQTCWLRDFLPENIQTGRIMTFGYDADAAFSRTTSDIDDHGSRLLVNLIDKREANDVRV